jgi:hypothetical protein
MADKYNSSMLQCISSEVFQAGSVAAQLSFQQHVHEIAIGIELNLARANLM